MFNILKITSILQSFTTFSPSPDAQLAQSHQLEQQHLSSILFTKQATSDEQNR